MMDGWMDGLEGVEINYLYCVVLHVSVLVLEMLDFWCGLRFPGQKRGRPVARSTTALLRTPSIYYDVTTIYLWK